MTRTGALLWKEWRDHRAAMLVFAVLVPLLSWPTQRYVFKFAEPTWTWQWIVPMCAALAAAFLAADSFAMDLATHRMTALVALPVPVRRHFAVRAAFLAVVAAAFAAWALVVNVAIVGVGGKDGAVAAMLASDCGTLTGYAICAAATAGVLVFSTLGVGGFRAFLGGVLLAYGAFLSTLYAVTLFTHLPGQAVPYERRMTVTWTIAAVVLGVAAFAGFAASRALPALRKRGALCAASVLLLTLGTPAALAGWREYRGWMVSPEDPDVIVETAIASPDGRYVAVDATRIDESQRGASRAWVVRTDDGALLAWPRRNELIMGWTAENLAWVYPSKSNEDRGRFAAPETGETVASPSMHDCQTRIVQGWGIGPNWSNWLRYESTPIKCSTPKVRLYSWRLSVRDGSAERTIEARSYPAPTPKVGEVLYVTEAGKLAVADLAGGEPRIVADDVTETRGAVTGSPDGRYFLVETPTGSVVFDSTTWKRVAGPFPDSWVVWCHGAPDSAAVSVTDRKTSIVTQIVDVQRGRTLAPTFQGLQGGHGSIQTLADGRFVARAGRKEVVLLDADAKYVRHLFPPKD